jgi:hypothetical protein
MQGQFHHFTLVSGPPDLEESRTHEEAMMSKDAQGSRTSFFTLIIH